VAGFAYLVCSRGFAELVECHFWRTDSSYRNQRHDAFEMSPITSDTGPQSNDIAAVRLWCLCSRGNKSRPAAWFQYNKGPLRNISADRIEHRVAVSDDLREIHRIVIDDLVGTNFAQIIMVRRACGRDHVRAQMFRQLYGKARHTACASLDQDRLASLKFQCVFDGANRRQSGKRQRGGIDMGQTLGFLCDNGCLDRDLLGVGSFLTDVADAEDLVANTKVSDTIPDF